MTRAWIILSSLVLGVLFKLWRDDYPQKFRFICSDATIPIQWGVYFFMEHLIAISIAACLIIKDDTPKFLFWLYFAIIVSDALYFITFYRDEGVGFNLLKVVIYGLALFYFQMNGNGTTD